MSVSDRKQHAELKMVKAGDSRDGWRSFVSSSIDFYKSGETWNHSWQVGGLQAARMLGHRHYIEFFRKAVENLLHETDFRCAVKLHRWEEAQVFSVVTPHEVERMEK